MEEIVVATVRKALDGLATRYLYTAQNIANANTPGYRAINVNFESALAEAATKSVDDVKALQVKTYWSPTSELSSELRLDLELAKASQTAMRYSALIGILSRQSEIKRLVVQGGQ